MTVDGSVTGDGWVRAGVVTFTRSVTGVTVDDFSITGFFVGATRTVRLNDSNVASFVGGVRTVAVAPTNGYSATWYLEVQRLSLQNGTYTIALNALGSGIVDEIGNALLADKSLSLTFPPSV